MSACPACGHENPDGAKFCSECAASILTVAAAPREERKVVTVLFADLVGFTARSEQLDPEDVRAFLSPYYARLRTELERFGGTVEKFIGDAVMALFGAPVAHEDDPERAVRAALAIRDWVTELEAGLQLRIAVNTGEVLVALGAQAHQGEGMASGDVINTTSRLQTAAPINGILVGETTYRATSQVITYRPADPVSAKGKTEAVAAWEAVEARSRLGVDLAGASRAALVGRQRELNLLRQALSRVRDDRSPQLVTVVGVPGIGKSRLVAELGRFVDDDPDLIFWRQGRSLPYGDGVTFWALGEMVKAQAGILETDSQEQAGEKLRSSVAAVIPEATDAHWVEGHLHPLAGLPSDVHTGSDRRDEAFTAWRRYFEGLAERSPLVLVFEDLHWADDNLLDFIEHLIDWASGVPMLIVCSARPELFERRSGWSGGTRHSITLSLAPLSDDETAQLISNLSDRPVMEAAAQQVLLARAGGNPLYAEQYVHMLAEWGSAAELPVPETVQGIIAARLDALPPEEKSLLQLAAVLGKVFWLGAVAHVGALERRAAEVQLHALERKDFVQRARRSSVADEGEYSFLHVLVREVAYRQIPRSQRAEQHRLVAEWIAALGRTEDNAEMLAHHYQSALELDRATGRPIDAAFAERAMGSFREAGDRAAALNAYASAAGFYQAALDLAPPGSLVRPGLLFQLARTQYVSGAVDIDLLVTARDELLKCGERETAADAEATLAEVYWFRGDTAQCASHLDRARDLVEGGEPSRAKASVITAVSRYLMLAGESGEAIRLGREALAMAEQLGLDELRAHALNNIGVAMLDRDDQDGLAELEHGLAIAVQANVPAAICRTRANICGVLLANGDVKESLVQLEQGAADASRFGLVRDGRWFRGQRSELQFLLGQWDEALTGAEEFLAEVDAGSPHYGTVGLLMVRARIRLGRDDIRGATADSDRALALARIVKDPQALFPAMAEAAHVQHNSGNIQRAAELVDEFLAAAVARAGLGFGGGIAAMHVLAWTACALGREEKMLAMLPVSQVGWVRAGAAFASGDSRLAADVCAEMGAVTEEAYDRVWLAEVLVHQGRRSEAEVELQRALAFYRRVGATRYLRQAEELLARSA
jgi:class 3 adenylate cyclase/tetratricopeptide (TPR) repeat protein